MWEYSRTTGDVDWSGLLPGDLLFWGKAATDTTRERITHVGMYIGDGKFIHSAQVVRVNSLDSSAADFYNRKPVRARRIVGHIDADGSGIISTLRSPLIQQVHHLLINSSLGSLN